MPDIQLAYRPCASADSWGGGERRSFAPGMDGARGSDEDWRGRRRERSWEEEINKFKEARESEASIRRGLFEGKRGSKTG
jgi:hypothetical protein